MSYVRLAAARSIYRAVVVNREPHEYYVLSQGRVSARFDDVVDRLDPEDAGDGNVVRK